MTSNQDGKQNELDIPRTGIDVMDDLSLDVHMMIYLASKGKLMPFRPPVIHESYMKLLLSCNYDTAVSKLTDWRYWKSDVEDFKLKYKDFLEELRQQKVTALAEYQKQGSPESAYFKEKGKKGGEQSKRNQAILSLQRYLVK